MYPAAVNTVIVSMGLGIWVEVNALVVNSEDLYQFRLGQKLRRAVYGGEGDGGEFSF